MKKRTTVYADRFLIHLAKAKGVNMSELFERALKMELDVPDDPRPRIRELKEELNVLLNRISEIDEMDQIWTELHKQYVGYLKSRKASHIALDDPMWESWITAPVKYKEFPMIKEMDPAEILIKLQEMDE